LRLTAFRSVVITFSRTLLVGGEFLDENTLRFHGILEDHIYAMELQVEVGIGDARIPESQHKWRLPRCPKSGCVSPKGDESPAGRNWVSK
jgi:hypothetical protein